MSNDLVQAYFDFDYKISLTMGEMIFIMQTFIIYAMPSAK